MIVYFAGVNTNHFCEAFIGRHVLETFTDPRPQRIYGRYRAVFKSMALDCGAYSALSQKVPLNIHEYGDFCLQHGAFYDWISSVDSIRGGVEENLRNWQTLSDRGLETMPTYHQGEPISVLRDYCSQAERVALGFKRNPDGSLFGGELPFLNEAFSHIPSTTKIHGWAMTGYTDRYPFASVDSATWNHELRALRAVRPEYQQGFTLDHLTDSELIEIIQKKYDRLPRMERWEGRRPPAQQRDLFSGAA